MTKTLRMLALAALPLLAACADAVTAPAAAPAGPSAVVGGAPACLNFDWLAPGETWGGLVGHNTGDMVHSESSVDVTVELFYSGVLALFDHSRAEDATLTGWGSGMHLHLQRISTRYDFMVYGGWTPGHVRFRYRDNGRTENLAVNGAVYMGDISRAPAVLGGASVIVNPGTVDVIGAVNELVIGGDDLWVDDVCATP